LIKALEIVENFNTADFIVITMRFTDIAIPAFAAWRVIQG
jgi:hypothetical protein